MGCSRSLYPVRPTLDVLVAAPCQTMAPVLEASKTPESRAEDHDTSSESSSKDMSEVAEVGSSTQHTPSPISASAVAELDTLDNTV